MIKPFNMTFFRWQHSLCLLPLALWLMLYPIQAQATAIISCTAGMNTTAGSTGNVNLGIITRDNADTASISATLNYTCTNAGDTEAKVSVCLAAGSGSNGGQIVPTRYMAGPNNSSLAFNMTLSGGEIWGDRSSGKEYQSSILTIAGKSSVSGSEIINVFLLSGNDNVNATQGVHTNNFDGTHTTLTVDTSTSADSRILDCLTVSQGIERFPFNVQATVVSSCFINATSNINLNSQIAGSTNIVGNNQNAITVTCMNSMPYTIGLTPSNSATNGAGVMTSKNANSDTIPYQLRSQPGLDGQIWGNTATATNQGNGIADTGNGQPKSHTVYVTVPQTDVRPDTYSDVVTVTVHY